jgi:hypothetical protein
MPTTLCLGFGKSGFKLFFIEVVRATTSVFDLTAVIGPATLQGGGAGGMHSIEYSASTFPLQKTNNNKHTTSLSRGQQLYWFVEKSLTFHQVLFALPQ